jgi:hypothetical protein
VSIVLDVSDPQRGFDPGVELERVLEVLGGRVEAPDGRGEQAERSRGGAVAEGRLDDHAAIGVREEQLVEPLGAR